MEVKVNEHCLEVSRERGKKPLFRGGSVHPGALLPAPIVLCIAFFFVFTVLPPAIAYTLSR